MTAGPRLRAPRLELGWQRAVSADHHRRGAGRHRRARNRRPEADPLHPALDAVHGAAGRGTGLGDHAADSGPAVAGRVWRSPD